MARGIPIALAVVLLTASGCIYSREISHTRRSVEHAFPGAHFDRKIVFSVGPFWLRASSWIMGMTADEDADMVAGYLDDIDRIKVGVYGTESLQEADGEGIPVLTQLLKDGWEPAVQVRDDDGYVWLLYRSRGDRILDAFVIVLDRDELVIARVKGHLDRLVSRAIRDHGPLRKLVRGGR